MQLINCTKSPIKAGWSRPRCDPSMANIFIKLKKEFLLGDLNSNDICLMPRILVRFDDMLQPHSTIQMTVNLILIYLEIYNPI